MALKNLARLVWKRLRRIFLYIFIAQLIYIFLLKWVDPPITMTQLGSLLGGYGLHRDYVDWEEISPNARLAVMASEDQLFPDHNGLDWKSIEKAMSHNKKKPKRIRGASTISQQVAKNVFLWQGRSYLRKGLEVYFTFLIEIFWSKKRIMEVYLNVIEMGNGIYGAEAASKEFFKKEAKNLTPSEAATLAAVLPNPRKWNAGKPNGYTIKRKNWILKQMSHLRGSIQL